MNFLKRFLDRWFPVKYELWGDTSAYIDRLMPFKLLSKHRFMWRAAGAGYGHVNGTRQGYGEAYIKTIPLP
jgi:hypothetical protein